MRKALQAQVALIGSGMAPLIVMRNLVQDGYRVVLINPLRDFFVEQSELPLDWENDDPLEAVRTSFSRDFPGPLEDCDFSIKSRIIASQPSTEKKVSWEDLEALYLKKSLQNKVPAQILDASGVRSRFPLVPKTTELLRGVAFSKSWTVDVDRFRHAVLQLVRERVDRSHVLSDVQDVEYMPGGVRFFHQGESLSVSVEKQTLIFSTPGIARLSQNWLRRFQSERFVGLPPPAREWKRWRIVSREAARLDALGVFGATACWANLREPTLLNVIEQVGERSRFEQADLSELRSLCVSFLGWDKFSVRELHACRVYDWSQTPKLNVKALDDRCAWVGRSDGNLFQVVEHATQMTRWVQERL